MTIRSLDVLGEVCPVPLFRTQQAVGALKPGEGIEILTDFARAVRNIMDWCERAGHSFEVDELENGVWLIRIIVKGGS